MPQFVQVTDNTGLNAGWKLEVSGTPFQTASGAELTGAELTLSGPRCVPSSIRNIRRVRFLQVLQSVLAHSS
ncbi:WxL domain-containing protein [Listeria aquatica]|uniref:WxL domain-containing protein n=1 Tax=Listeria aquatica TaxID=1494960 RepID=UPI0031F58F63